MLHEILLALSGYSSPLFKANSQDEVEVDPDFPVLQPAEKTLLKGVGKLSHLHRNLKIHLRRIASTHKSAICRAVAASIQDVHLQRFQKKILDVESRILRSDASLVGAYKIVPLASVVGEFDEWPRVMDWYWQLACRVLPTNADSTGCSAADLIDHLRRESLTGYPEVEAAATSLSMVAERAWLHQVSLWVLYGDLPVFGADDFFIRKNEASGEYGIYESLCPKLANSETRSSMLFIGRSLKLISSRTEVDFSPSMDGDGSLHELAQDHAKVLSQLKYPLSTSVLAQAIREIRSSLSRRALSRLLPLPKVLQTLDLLRDFFLLGRGEFAMALISEADEKLEAKSRANASSLSTKLSDVLKIMAIKDAELRAMLFKTWTVLARQQLGNDEADDDMDELLDLARDMIQLVPYGSKPSKKSKSDKDLLVSFNDILLPMPTRLTLQITSPTDLFLSSADLEMYSSLNAYLLAIRRAHMHLTSLWRETGLRRENLRSIRLQDQASRARFLSRANQRHSQMRKIWATSGAATFLLSELGEYLEGQVLNESWKALRTWIEKPMQIRDRLSRLESSSSSATNYERGQAQSSPRDTLSLEVFNIQRDPEMLATAHRRFLTSLNISLLHANIPFTKALRSLLTNIDLLAAHITRLKTVQQNMDLESDTSSTGGGLVNHQREGIEVLRDLDRSRKSVDTDLKAVVRCLRDIDADRDDVAVFDDGDLEDESVFRPVVGPRVERLLMKLDFDSGVSQDEEVGEEGFHYLL